MAEFSSSADPGTPTYIVDRAVFLIDREGGLIPFFRNVGVGGVAMATIAQTIGMITGVGGVIMKPLEAFGDGIAGLVDATFGTVVVGIIEAGGNTAIASFATGTWSLLGPAAAPAAVVTAMVTIWLFMEFVDRIGFSPLAFIQRLRS